MQYLIEVLNSIRNLYYTCDMLRDARNREILFWVVITTINDVGKIKNLTYHILWFQILYPLYHPKMSMIMNMIRRILVDNVHNLSRWADVFQQPKFKFEILPWLWCVKSTCRGVAHLKEGNPWSRYLNNKYLYAWWKIYMINFYMFIPNLDVCRFDHLVNTNLLVS